MPFSAMSTCTAAGCSCIATCARILYFYLKYIVL